MLPLSKMKDVDLWVICSTSSPRLRLSDMAQKNLLFNAALIYWSTWEWHKCLLRPVKMKQGTKQVTKAVGSNSSSVSKTWIGGTVQRVSLLSWPRESVPREVIVWGQGISASLRLPWRRMLSRTLVETVLFFCCLMFIFIVGSFAQFMMISFYIFICWAVWASVVACFIAACRL